MNIKKITVFKILLFTILTVSFQMFALAQNPPPIIPTGSGEVKIPHSTAENQGAALQNSILPGIATAIITLTGTISLLMVIYGGILYLTTYMDAARAQKATQTITWALAGLIISGLSYAIVRIVISLNLQ